MWEKGGNEYGNQAFIHWGNVRSKSNDELTETEREWIVRRERFMERHEKDFRINGVVAVMKWGGIVQEGMKELIK